MLYAWLLFLFSDVICIFADDFSGADQVTQYLITWATISSRSSVPQRTQPQIIIVLTHQITSATHHVLETENLHFNLCQPLCVFAFNKLLHLAGDHLSPLAHHWWLKEILLNEADTSQVNQLQLQTLFSVTHLQAFFYHALHHLSQSVTQLFNFIKASCIGNDILEDYSHHLVTFLGLSSKYKLSYDNVAYFITFNIFLDAFPPNMHSMWSLNFFVNIELTETSFWS